MSKLVDLPDMGKKPEKSKVTKKRKTKASTSTAPPPMQRIEETPERDFSTIPSLGKEFGFSPEIMSITVRL